MATTTTSPVRAKHAKGSSVLLGDEGPQDIFTPEDLSEEQRQIAKTATEFVTNEVLPLAEQIEAKNIRDIRALLRKAGDLALTAVDVPVAYGGLKMDAVTSALGAES